MKSYFILIAAIIGIEASLKQISKQQNLHCDAAKLKNIWFKTYTANAVRGGYREEQCFFECEQMAKTFDERALFDSNQQELCCNYAAWEDGNYSCDLYLGTRTAPELADEYGAAYLFISAYDEK